MKLRIAVLQLNPRIGSVNANIERANAILKAHGFNSSNTTNSKASKELDVLVLPELAFTGYNFKSKTEITPYLEPTASGISTSWAKKTALSLGCHTLVGYPELSSSTPSEGTALHEKIYNSAVMVSPKGDVVFNYRKTFLYETDEGWGCSEPPTHTYNDGTAFPLTGNITLASGQQLRTQVGICMDLNPYKFKSPFTDYEFANAALKNKASLILCPTAWLHPDSPDIMTQKDDDDDDGNPITEDYKRSRLAEVLEYQIPEDPNMSTVNYWLMRMNPFLKIPDSNSRRKAFVVCNRSGVEDLTMYAGSSSIFGLDSQTNTNEVGVIYRGSLGQAEESLLYSEIDVDE